MNEHPFHSCLLLALGALLLLQPLTIDAQHIEGEQPAVPASNPDSLQNPPDSSETRLIVYYFHGRKRCASCRTIEMYTHDALLKYFPEQIKAGGVEWQVRNFANPKYAHFKEDFALFAQSVVLVEMKGDETLRWKNLTDVWKLIREKDAFYGYIQTEASAFLGAE